MKYTIPVIIILVVISFLCVKKITRLQEEVSRGYSTIKAYEQENAELGESTRAHILTIDQLRTSMDSVNRSIYDLKEELRIKDKELLSALHRKEVITKTDTILIKDTIFSDPDFHLDTLLSEDQWYSLRLELAYPGSIIVSPVFMNDETVLTSLRKETVRPRKKFFLARWFQKKHKVIIVTVLQKNKYASEKQRRFIQIAQ